jgi:hypothetical protein
VEGDNFERFGGAPGELPSAERVELEGRLTFGEALRYSFLHRCGYWSNWATCTVLAFIALLVLRCLDLIPPGTAADRFLPGGTSPLTILVVFGFVGFILPYLIAREQYKGPDLSDPTHYTFDAVGYEVVQPVWRYRVDWTSVREIRESRSMFLLYLNRTQRTIIPQRFFPDDQTLAAWRVLVATHAPSVPIRRNSIAGRFL